MLRAGFQPDSDETSSLISPWFSPRVLLTAVQGVSGGKGLAFAANETNPKRANSSVFLVFDAY